MWNSKLNEPHFIDSLFNSRFSLNPQCLAKWRKVNKTDADISMQGTPCTLHGSSHANILCKNEKRITFNQIENNMISLADCIMLMRIKYSTCSSCPKLTEKILLHCNKTDVYKISLKIINENDVLFVIYVSFIGLICKTR